MQSTDSTRQMDPVLERFLRAVALISGLGCVAVFSYVGLIVAGFKLPVW